MSQSSFPRPEHILILTEKIREILHARELNWELADRGINQFRCQYRIGLRPAEAPDWIEVAIHFQVAARLRAGGTEGNDAEIRKILDPIVSQALSRE